MIQQLSSPPRHQNLQKEQSPVSDASLHQHDNLADSYPMTAAQFLQLYRSKMLDEEIKEFGSEAGQFKTIYYPGSIPNRQSDDLSILKTVQAERTEIFKEKAAAAEEN